MRAATVVTEHRPDARTIPLAELREKLRALAARGDGQLLSIDLERAAEELARRGVRELAPAAPGSRLRYAGAVGGSEVEVRGLGNVVVDDSGDEIVITTRDATIRIRPGAVTSTRRNPRSADPR